MLADHSQAEIVAWQRFVSTLKAQAALAVIYCSRSIITERVVCPFGEHDVFGEVYPVVFSLFDAHTITAYPKLSRAFGVSGWIVT